MQDIIEQDVLESGNEEEEEKDKSEQDKPEKKEYLTPMPVPTNINLPHWKTIEVSEYCRSGLSQLEFTTPTPIQKKTIPLALQGRDLVGKATTGSGKTLAYGIPILEKYLTKLQSKTASTPTGIIFVPTRELAHQVTEHLTNLSKYYPFHPSSIVSITGGLSIQKQERLLKNGPGILVATPGRCLELIEKHEHILKSLSSTDIIVLDEADRLLQDGHFDEFDKILDLFKKHRPKKLDQWRWQTLVFSATFAKELFGKLTKTTKNPLIGDEIVPLLSEKLSFKDKQPQLIDANPKEIVSGQITEALVECGATERDLYLYYFLLLYKGSTLVFANSIDSVKRLVPLLNHLNIPAFAIHSGMMQKQRLRALERFKESSDSNQVSVLVASDVAARGLDIPAIDHVAHYHLPRSADIYIHRAGRTARAGNEGVSVMFCSPQEASGPLKKLRKLVADTASNKGKLNTHGDVKLLPIEDDLVSQLRPRVTLAGKLANSSISNTSTRKENSWIKQAAEDLGIDNLLDIDDFEDDFIKKQKKKNHDHSLSKEEANSIKYELKELMRHPIRKLNRRSYLTSGLQNLAHIMVTGKTHSDILGKESSNALDVLKKSKNANKSNPNRVTKPAKPTKQAKQGGKQANKKKS